MPLPNTNVPISMSMINSYLGRTSNAQANFNESLFRELGRKTTADTTIKISDLAGKSKCPTISYSGSTSESDSGLDPNAGNTGRRTVRFGNTGFGSGNVLIVDPGITGFTQIDYLIVAGGGGGGRGNTISTDGGGGGAGGYVESNIGRTFTGETWRFDVGRGGARATSQSVRGSMGETTFLITSNPSRGSITAGGGGGGGSSDNAVRPGQNGNSGTGGGSGGGGGRSSGNYGGGGAEGNSPGREGRGGGATSSPSAQWAGGGGGPGGFEGAPYNPRSGINSSLIGYICQGGYGSDVTGGSSAPGSGGNGWRSGLNNGPHNGQNGIAAIRFRYD